MIFLRLGTWNTQGGAAIGRQILIDNECHERSLDIVCVQDVRVHEPTFQTEHYRWLSSATSERCSRVSAFLIRKGWECEVQLVIVSNDIQLLYIRTSQHSLVLINLYMPCERTVQALGAFQQLYTLLSELQTQYPDVPYVVLGDTNAHLAADLLELDCDARDHHLLGNYLLHTDSNENGSFLWEVMRKHQLCAVTTMIDSSTLKTRYQAGFSSQLDHIFVPVAMIGSINNLKGSWARISDHKLITVQIRLYATEGNCLT